MTKDAVIDCVHRTIYGFIDVVADDSEEPISEKDKLLLEVNKEVCSAIKAMPDEERKTGKWVITKRNGILCGVCHSGFRRMPTLDGKPIFRYCPFCGAKMEGAE